MPTAGRSCWRAAASRPRCGPGSPRRDFVEVETAALQVSPGNETHLHAFATELIGPGGRARSRSICTPRRNSPARSCWRPARRRIFDFARVFRNRERGALHHPEFTMLEWYRAERALRDADGRLRGAAGARRRDAAGAKRVRVPRPDHRSVRRAGAPDRGGGLRALCRHRSAGDGRRRAGRPRRPRRRGGQGRRAHRRRRHLGRHLQPHPGRAGRAAARHRPGDHPVRVSAAAGGAGAGQARQRPASPSASSSMPAASNSPTPSAN